MKNWILIVFALFLLSSNSIFAQTPTLKNGLSWKTTIVDYKGAANNEFGNFRSYLSGLEVGYNRNLLPFLNAYVPFRAGTFRAVDAVRSTPYGALDLQAQVFLPGNHLATPYLLAGISGVKERERSIYTQFPVGLGLDLKVARNSFINVQVDYRFTGEEDRKNVQIGFGFKHLIGKIDDTTAVMPIKVSDRDGDGVPDEMDKCPDIAGYLAFDGCPDTDKDGIPDAEDECPDVVGPKATKGCPDSDADGIADNVDDCPDKPGPIQFNGCPDTDGDGIPDNKDECPTQKGPTAFNGCPDTDLDGVEDRKDKCPNTPGPARNFGCPEIQAEEKKVLEFAMRAVQFELGKATLLKESNKMLDQIVGLMKKYPDYGLIISGHTDNTGNDDLNQSLSERRAQTCYEYLKSKGISPLRMSYAGFGETQPLYDNKTGEGRKLNRRVEFNMVLK